MLIFLLVSSRRMSRELRLLVSRVSSSPEKFRCIYFPRARRQQRQSRQAALAYVFMYIKILCDKLPQLKLKLTRARGKDSREPATIYTLGYTPFCSHRACIFFSLLSDLLQRLYPDVFFAPFCRHTRNPGQDGGDTARRNLVLQ